METMTSADWYVGSYPSSIVYTGVTFTPVITLNVGDNYIYAITTDSSGCTTIPDSIDYFLSDTSLMSAIDDVVICLGAEIDLGASGGVSYLWDSHPDINDVTAQNPAVKPDMETTYKVQITDVYGCVKTDEVHVSFMDPDSCVLNTFNAFTPNGDGNNDFLYIEGIEGYPGNSVFIYNRWGDRMIRIDDYDNEDNVWDGTNAFGNDMKAGTYYFVVDVGNKERNFAGWAQLIR